MGVQIITGPEDENFCSLCGVNFALWKRNVDDDKETREKNRWDIYQTTEEGTWS